ncbi:hypothetical protein [Aliikangiella coralliicola]|uniref:Uncharacterized protein n=1 Tax=Aliikangiella coralliicola TaxID=2592383 RepID=A0A545UG87_9GAMM|nr:hypothetical protein [Aliikangiella coralliicola]TQV88488.1 hypothetical protein FLL46_08160 [Aliikangiella coralliicola]
MPRTTIVNGQIVIVPDSTPRQEFTPFSGVGQTTGGVAPRSRLLDLIERPRRAHAESHPALKRPPLMDLSRYEMLLTIREYMELSYLDEVLVFGASKEIVYPFLCTPCSHITMVSFDENDVPKVIKDLQTCCSSVELLHKKKSLNKTQLKVLTSCCSVPLTINLLKMTYSQFKTVSPSKSYRCLIDKASWLYTDPQGWADYLYKLKVDGFLITDFDYTWGGSAPWLVEVFGLYDVTNSVVGYFRTRKTGYGYDEDSARVYVKVKEVPQQLMQTALVCAAEMDPLLKLYRFPTMELVGSWLNWGKFRSQANLIKKISALARKLDQFRYGAIALRLDRIHQQMTQWINQKERADRLAGEHYLDD